MTFIVGEIGVNWDGNIELVKDMILRAKTMGFDAIKFQSFNEKIIENHPQKNRLLKSSISSSNIDQIDAIARNIGIEWFCTPMYEDAVDMLESYVKRFKIRLKDGIPLLENKSTILFEKILKTNKEIIVSSENSPKNSKFYDNKNIKWLYCVPKYPCSFEEIDFSSLKDFDGYSNHCPHIIAPLTAAILGGEIIEVHITSDKSKDFIDNPVSFDFNELEKLIDLIRSVKKIKRW